MHAFCLQFMAFYIYVYAQHVKTLVHIMAKLIQWEAVERLKMLVLLTRESPVLWSDLLDRHRCDLSKCSNVCF